jgi:hypothetical protein
VVHGRRHDPSPYFDAARHLATMVATSAASLRFSAMMRPRSSLTVMKTLFRGARHDEAVLDRQVGRG